MTNLKEKNPGKYPGRMGKAWSQDEEQQLLREIQKKVPEEMIAELHERSIGSIHSRLREIAANYYFNNNLQLNEIQKFTGLTIDEISDAISRREYRMQMKEKKTNEKTVSQVPPIQETIKEEKSDTKEIISLLKDIKGLLEKFLSNIHYEE